MEGGEAELLSQLISSQHSQSQSQPRIEHKQAQHESNLHALAAVLATHKGIVAARAVAGTVSCPIPLG
jgi:hypothetical protein